MDRLLLEHPPLERLAAFRVGDLNSNESTEVEGHVADCNSCCERLRSLPDDSLIALLRQSLAVPSATAACKAETGIPPELVDHPRYRLQGLLGSGGMGAVYKAEHLLMERTVALKVISRSLTDRPAVVERFRQEVKAAARLSHPNIVAAHDAEQAGETHFLVMEFVAGTTLAQLVEEQGPLPVERACDCAAQAARGLEHAWRQGMIHRDVKPHNLMLAFPSHDREGVLAVPLASESAGVVKVLDFGLARFASEVGVSAASARPEPEQPGSMTATGLVLGTADYVAPEQAEAPHTADIRSDLYSLGCTLYFLLTGQVPFPGSSALEKLAAHRERQPRPVTDFRKDVPDGLVRVLDRLMAKDPACRYQTPGEVAEALAPFSGTCTKAEPKPPRRRWFFRIPTLFAATCAAVLAGTLLVIRTDSGEFVLETDNDKVAVLVDRAGVKIRDLSSRREYLLKVGRHDVRSGEYEIDVSEPAQGLEFSVRRFILRRGGKVRVTARVRAGVPEEVSRAELKKLQGRWKPVRAEYNGVPMPARMFALVRSVIAAGDTIRVTRVDGIQVSIRVRLDPRTSPKSVEATAYVGLKKEPMVDVVGIYKLERDTLTLCVSERRDNRPTEFVTRPRSGYRLIVFRRETERNGTSKVPRP